KAGSLAYRIQLCAQALCLEEMLSVSVPEGAVYDGSTRRRHQVALDSQLRAAVESLARQMHELFKSGTTPPPVLKKASQSCSFKERCFPESLAIHRQVESYYRKFLTEDSD